MTESSPILLPLLRGPLPSHAFETPAQPDHSPATGVLSAPQWSGALRLWPGLPDAPANYFCPDKYPFSPREAQVCLGDLQQMGDAALSGLPVGAAAAAGNSRAARRASEMALLKGLGSSDGDTAAALAAEAARKEQLALSQAQKALLWAWLQEERLVDLAELTTQFAQNAGGLTAALGIDPDDLDGLAPDALTGDLVRLCSPIALDASLVPPWRLVTANALYFVPADAPLIAEGPMREDLLELLDFVPAQRWQGLLEAAPANAVAAEARAPGWQVLGHTRPTGQPQLDAERVWVTWRIAA